MKEITIASFGGRAPKISDRLISDTSATVADNCKLLSGELRGIRAPSLLHTFPNGTNPKRVWRATEPGQAQVAWYGAQTPEAELVKSPLVNDAFARWYIFEPSQPPKVLTFSELLAGTAPHDLAVAHPIAGLGLTAVNGPAANTFETRVYVATYVTSWGEESEPSPPASVLVDVDGSVDTTGFYNTPAAAISGRTFSSVRIYRTVTGATGGNQLFFVADVPFGQLTYLDAAPSATVAFNATLQSYNTAPPSGIYGARVHSSGSLVAFSGRDIYFSRPYLPHAWPDSWRISVQDKIVAIETVGQNILVLTEGYPVLLYGVSAAAMGVRRLPFPAPCESYNSVVAAPEGVYYASDSGLALFNGSGHRVVTSGFISREDWQAQYTSSTSFATIYERQYISRRADGTGYIINAADPGRATLVDLKRMATSGAFATDRNSGAVYMISGDQVFEWDPFAGEEVDYKWRSKAFYAARQVSMATIKVDLDPRPIEWVPGPELGSVFSYTGAIDKRSQVAVAVIADGAVVFSAAVWDKRVVAITSTVKATVWQVEVSGQCRVHRVSLSISGKGQSRV